MKIPVFDYSHPRYAARTIRSLRKAWPDRTFDVVPSSVSAHGFRYVIQVTMPNGRKAIVIRTKLKNIGRKEAA